MNDSKTVNELVSKMAQRAGELSAQSVVMLRLGHPDNLAGTKSGAQWQGMSKSRLVSDILYEEFHLEFDRSIIDD